MADGSTRVGGSSIDLWGHRCYRWRCSVGSGRLCWSTRCCRPILRLRVFNGVASALLAIFNAAITVWPMVALNVTLTAINVLHRAAATWQARHTTFEVVEISPNQAYLKHLLHEFDTDIQHFDPGFSSDDATHTDLGFLILTGAETVGLVLLRNAGDGSAQVDLDYVVPRYQGFTVGEFVYRPGGPLAMRGYRRVIAPPRMQNAGDYLTDVGFRPDGDAMVRDLA
jgi:hypothetical protein